jgi:hypothetical protein
MFKNMYLLKTCFPHAILSGLTMTSERSSANWRIDIDYLNDGSTPMGVAYLND